MGRAYIRLTWATPSEGRHGTRAARGGGSWGEGKGRGCRSIARHPSLWLSAFGETKHGARGLEWTLDLPNHAVYAYVYGVCVSYSARRPSA